MRQYEVSNYQIRRYECVRETAYGQHKHKWQKVLVILVSYKVSHRYVMNASLRLVIYFL